ncbi:DUF302 domain-containing protein [Streptomyces sp. SHP 1-2]|uniref:DUF302 domain-containing protein n=1 Tax=Streptomyces sp. SHP 1-2 TaxID=2769489 RepID=UPI0022371638|nr:DUF302 domain-containing protein [Streptomyces sp. SHP 1-2]MCW5252024.1 DUF302 domain-containing protein [Streptomyces sp. SHP 1-2]
MEFGITVTLDTPFTETVERVRAALAEEGFGVLTEIDVRATMKEKLGEEMEDYLILGACNPALAHRALGVERQIGLLLPCNVTVRAVPEGVVVEAMDPALLVQVTGRAELDPVAGEAAERLTRALASLKG